VCERESWNQARRADIKLFMLGFFQKYSLSGPKSEPPPQKKKITVFFPFHNMPIYHAPFCPYFSPFVLFIFHLPSFHIPLPPPKKKNTLANNPPSGWGHTYFPVTHPYVEICCLDFVVL
jgi:hypothetical protein